MNECKAGHYTSNDVVLHGALICCGGLGQPRCKYYEDCLKDFGFKLSKNGRRIRVKKENLK